MNHKNRKIIKLAILLIVLVLSIGIIVSRPIYETKQIDLSQFHGTYLQPAREIGQFSLKGTDGNVFNNESLKKQWTMIFFGFTRCGSICPTTMAELAKTYKILEKKGVEPLPQVVMISLDPEYDSLDKLTSYVRTFNKHFIGASGANSEILKITKELGIAYAKVAASVSTDPENYSIEHSGALMLFNPKGQLVAFFTTPHQAEFLAKDFQLLVS